MAQAKPKLKEAAEPQDAPDLRERRGGDDSPDDAPMLADCPVQPLGKLKQRHYFLDEAQQLIDLAPREFGKNELVSLFGRKAGFLEKKWPMMKNVGTKAKPEFVPDGFHQGEAAYDLITACAHKGMFDPQGKVRGRGAHRGGNDELVLHCGDAILIGGERGPSGRKIAPQYRPPGMIGEFVYPAGQAIVHPDPVASSPKDAEDLLELLASWHWARPGIDEILAMGWMVAAMICGVLTWRPHIWIHGPSGAGKSTLQMLFRNILGAWALETEDATEAALRQTLNMDTLAVMYDEAEPDEDGSRALTKIIKLVRLASSGSNAMRGGTNHESQQFIIRSCFMFSSILHQELPQQDRNRITILQLQPFKDHQPRLQMDPAQWKSWGGKMRRRLVEQWGRFEQTLLTYQSEMLDQGYEARHQDQYGTLLACADMVMYDFAPPDAMDLNGDPDRVKALVHKLSGVLETVRRESEGDTERCLKWIGTKQLTAAGGAQRETVGQWIEKALSRGQDAGGTATEFDSSAHKKLMSHGLKLVNQTFSKDRDGNVNYEKFGLKSFDGRDLKVFLAVANKSNTGISELFDGSLWKGGVWTQSLALIPGAHRGDGCKVRFTAGPENCLIIPVHEFVDFDAIVKENRAILQRGDEF
jgi:hypothetical protein